ncbi:MAG: hypothetical protein WC812_02410 [Candidatus Pacearchaeota archaeon]|jgi:hypothetical protein
MVFSKYSFGKLEDYIVEYDFAGKIYHSVPIEACNKEQVKELFKRNYDKSCLIKKIKSSSEICDEIVENLMQSIKKSFEKSKLEFSKKIKILV